MNYNEPEVLDIIKQCTDKNPEQILLDWNNKKANTPLDLEKRDYPYFVYSFPLIVNNEEIATITLVSLYGGDLNSKKPNLMQKYLGHIKYEESWWAFSHDTYLDCYLTIHKEFELPEIVEDFYGGTFKTVDTNGKEFEFTVSYGRPLDFEKHGYVYYQYTNKAYRFLNNDINIQIKEDEIEGWKLGEKINENISKRLN